MGPHPIAYPMPPPALSLTSEQRRIAVARQVVVTAAYDGSLSTRLLSVCRRVAAHEREDKRIHRRLPLAGDHRRLPCSDDLVCQRYKCLGFVVGRVVRRDRQPTEGGRSDCD